MSSNNPPSPLMFKSRRLMSVPPATSISSIPHAFRNQQKPRGDSSEEPLIDTGIFIALGAVESFNILMHFHSTFDGRSKTTDAVQDEVKRHAASNHVTSEEAKLRAAALRSDRFFFVGSRMPVAVVDVQDPASAKLIQQIYMQLHLFDEARKGRSGSSQKGVTAPVSGGRGIVKHAGEATLIALASTMARPLILTNDSGASVVAAKQTPSVPSIHFADVLKQIICHSDGEIPIGDITTAFAEARLVSQIAEDACPSDPVMFFLCSADVSTKVCSICG